MSRKGDHHTYNSGDAYSDTSDDHTAAPPSPVPADNCLVCISAIPRGVLRNNIVVHRAISPASPVITSEAAYSDMSSCYCP